MSRNDDAISRQAAMEEISKQQTYKMFEGEDTLYLDANDVGSVLASLPPAQPTLYGYSIDHLALIADVMKKEGVSPEEAERFFKDTQRIYQMLVDEIQKQVEGMVESCVT